MEASVRCAAHPARPAHDQCPRCGRPRCAADGALAARCAVCRDVEARGVRAPLVVLAGTGAAGTLAGVAGAVLGQEYVGARGFSVVFPALVGLAVAVLAVAWAGPLRPAVRHGVAVLTASYAALSSLLDFRFTDEPYGPAGRWLPPLAAAAAAAAVATEVLARRPLSARASGDRAPVSTPSR